MILIGNVGRVPQERVNSKNVKFFEFSVATNDGEDNTFWVSVIISAAREKVVQFLTKGKQVYLEGGFSIDVYKGEPSVTLFADVVQLLGTKDNAQAEDIVDRKPDVY